MYAGHGVNHFFQVLGSPTIASRTLHFAAPTKLYKSLSKTLESLDIFPFLGLERGWMLEVLDQPQNLCEKLCAGSSVGALSCTAGRLCYELGSTGIQVW